MDEMTLARVLEEHAKWLCGDGGARADLTSADLSGADLRRADLSGADLRRADLRNADLSSADLRRADLRNADLSSADLRRADLRNADLSSADLSGADLRRADLSGADLSGANLSGANLCGSDLSRADLSGANNLSALAVAQTRICPDGQFDAWKSLRTANGAKIVARIRLPAEARRSNATGRKCRAEYVDVLEIIGAEVGYSTPVAKQRLVYRAGERVTCHKWCDDRWQECAGGIHFFLTREEAETY